VCPLATTLGVLLFSFSIFAQGNFGRIVGTVTDQTGAVLAGAGVTIIDVDRGLSRSLVTDSAGEYNAPTLIPGNYAVRVEIKGFKTLTRQNIVLEVGKEVRIDLTPQPGEQTQSVTVEAAAPLVESTNATLGGTLNNADINDMPLNGRNYQNLLSLRPGVQIQPGGSPWTQSTNNSRPDDTVWMLDGILNVNLYDYRPIAMMPAPFTDGATILPIDAIQEFNLEENPKAEFGWRPGAIVNVGIKSGTNSFHGSAYAFGRDQDWDARNFFNPKPNPIQPTQLEQFGGVAGGRIKRDKLFFFAGYEGLRSFIGNPIPTTVPELAMQTPADPKNSMVDAIQTLQAKGVPLSPVSMALFGCGTLAAPAFPCTGGIIQGASANTTLLNAGYPNTNTSNNGVAKIDYNLSAKHRINGLLLIGNYLGDGADHPIVNAAFKNSNPLRTYTASGNWVYVPSSTVVNEFRMGFNHVRFALVSDDANVFPDGKGYPINTGITTVGGFPTVTLTGFQAPLGAWRGRPLEFTNPYYDFQDSISYLRGKHALKFGVEYTHIQTDVNIHDTRGRIDFQGKQISQITCPSSSDPTQLVPCSTPLEDFFAGLPSRGSQLVGATDRLLNWMNLAAYVQDDWRVTPKLTVNLGLRYAYVSPMKEANNLLGSFDPTLGMLQQGQSALGDTLWKPDHRDWSPRLGFAYDVGGKGTTVVRGGFGKIYSIFTPAQFMQSPFSNFKNGTIAAVPTGACQTPVIIGTPCTNTFGGTIQLGTASIPKSALNWNGVVFPQGAGIACTAKSQCDLTVVDPNLKTPYMLNWNFGIQHAFSNNLSLEIGYVGTHGDNLTGFVDLNQIDPATGLRPYAVQFPYLRFITQTTNDARSNYHSLQTTLTKRLSHGLNFTAGYTYGHGLDNGSLNRFGNLPQDSRNPAAEYGNSDTDIRHRLTLTATYLIPGKKGYGQLLDGWKLNTIVTLQSGLPWLVQDQGNDFSGTSEFADRWNFFGNPDDFRSGSNSLPYCTHAGFQGCSVTNGATGDTTYFSPSESTAMWAQCTAVAPDPLPGGTLDTGGCYVKGKSVMVPPKQGSFGTMGRNIFRDRGFKNVDFSVFKDFRFRERIGAEFRVELFNVFNHPNFANPYGAAVGAGFNDPSGGSSFGCGCTTPDVAAGNPLVGSGNSRVMQLGLKFTF
jgi:hypothetical protein